MAEMEFRNGIREGLSRAYFPSGAIWIEQNYHYSRLHGDSREWFENGKLKTRSVYEFSILIECDVWDESGNVISVFRLDENHPDYKTLQIYRHAKWRQR
ncbi:MAG: hypothetical protein JSR62_15495 [Nitrospira sp.]|nr:hypothetical protein [Nitrospira sp.]